MPIYRRPFLYPEQLAFVDSPARGNVIEASTKSGKTVGAIVWLYEQALQAKPGSNCWWVAPVFSQADIAFNRLKRFIKSQGYIRVNEARRTIQLRNNVTIWFKSGDNVDSLYGDDVIAAVIDEATRCRDGVYAAVRSTLTATGGRLKIIGNVKGKTNWVYKLGARIRAGELPGWEYFRITSQDAIRGGIFTAEELAEAERSLPPEIFKELYMAEAWDDRGKPFIYSWDDQRNIDYGAYSIRHDLPVYLSFDFNINPIVATCHQHADDKGWSRTFDEFRLKDDNIYSLCDAIKSKIGDGYSINYRVNGDASGQNRSALVQGDTNYFTIIKQELLIPSRFFEIPKSNPSIRNSRVLSNSLYSRHPNFKVTLNCTKTIEDLRNVQVTATGDIDKSDPTITHLLDTVRYYHWANFYDFIKKTGAYD